MGVSSLSTALSGLRVNQQQIDVISNNIANVGTEGFTRKILPQSTQAVDGRSIGVLGGTITRNVDLRLERDLWTQVSSVSFYGVQETYLTRIDQFHGAPDANISVAAEIGKLQDTFSALANAPDNQFLLSDVVDQAQDTANKINDLADFYTTLRNDVQSEAETVVENINNLLIQIADLNSQIRFANLSGRTVANTEDQRDQAISNLSEYIDVSVFSRGDGVVVVQTKQGVELAGETVTELVFNPTPLSASNAYPATAAAVTVGDPADNANAPDITQRNIGGRLGGLLALRDQTFPKQIAQLDELAHKLATRFDQQGLRLFTDQSGTVPLDTPPNPTTNPPTPVEYVGFASNLQVNSLVINNRNLIQTGTAGGTLQSGANDVLRRIIEYTFGPVDYQLAANTDPATSIDIRAAATGGTTIQDWLGLASTNTVTTGIALTNFASVADIVTAGGVPVFGSGAAETDTFILRFDDPDFGAGPYDIEIDLRTVAASGVNAAQDLVNHITADPDFAGALADFGASVSVDANGQLLIESRGDITIATSPAEPISAQGLAFVGLALGTTSAKDPYFDVQVGNNAPSRIVIAPTDTETELLAKLNAVEGLAAQIDADGFLSLRPGNSFINPDFGGDLRVIGGPFQTSGASLAGTALGRTSLDDGVNIAQALFGTYTVPSPGVIDEFSPINEILYQSETQAGSGVFIPFREQFLGPAADIETQITASQTLRDFSQKIISNVAQELALFQQRGADEESLRGLLEQQSLNRSAVNIDEELGNLIVIQTAYSASARVITVINEIFDELLNVL